MAKRIPIPTYTQQRELPAGPNQLPSVRQTAAPTADQLGANARVPTDYVGQGLRSAGKDFMDVGLQMQAREDADLVMRAETVLHDRLREKQAEWSKRRGVQAWGITEDATGWWDDEAVKAAEGLNERQRVAFEQTRQRLRTQSLNAMSRYEFDQRHQSLDESAQANVVASINFAAANPTDPAAIAAARADVERAVNARAGINGWVTARRDLEMGSKLTLLHKQVLQTLVDQNPAAAKAYLDAHEEEIDGAERAEIRKMVDGGARLAKVQEFADQYDPAAGAVLSDALATARKEFEGEDEKLAVAEVKARFADHALARKQASEAVVNEVYTIVAETGSIAKVPPSLLAKLDGEDRVRLVSALESRAAARESRAAARESREWTAEQRRITVSEAQGLENYYTLSQAFAKDPKAVTPEMVQRAALDRDISPAQAQRLIAQITNNTVRAEAVHTPTLSAVMSPIVKGLKWTGDNGRKRAGLLQQVAEEQILAEQFRLGKPLSQDEMRSIVNRLVVEGTVERDYWFDDKKRRYEVLGTDDEARWKPSNRTIVRSGTNKATGKRVVEYNDGTIEEVEQ